MYIAHINDDGVFQTVAQHSLGTAELSRNYATDFFKTAAYDAGLLHDIGKYQSSFQRRINGSSISVDHSTCGAKAVPEFFGNDPVFALILEYCISGHHSGIPDGGLRNDTPDMPTLSGRLKKDLESFDAFRDELPPPLAENDDIDQLVRSFRNPVDSIELFAFITRYVFSCLTDADSTDTADFCDGTHQSHLASDFSACLKKVNRLLSSFEPVTELQKTRSRLQKQVFEKAEEDSDIYLMNMPTGSGKTLCSLKFALQRAIRTGKKHIIYIIPYNSIIDQTVSVFENVLGKSADILRHQSTFSFDDRDDKNEDYKTVARLAAENWDADFIITTAVQFFESVYGNKRGKLRKLHNMAQSVLIFDEAHLMPMDFLAPCLRAISYLTEYCGSEAVFLTATMPDFRELISEYASKTLRVTELITDKSCFSAFAKCRYINLGCLESEQVAMKAAESPASLIVVNSRKEAKKLYSECKGRKYHLSTYMTAFDRKHVIESIKSELARLCADYPDQGSVPEDRRITVVSTSLIEAGVDLDFFTVFRELTGLDSILQAGGRCNREGTRSCGDVFIFTLRENEGIISRDEKVNITKGLLKQYDDISDRECISSYYKLLYFVKRDAVTSRLISRKPGCINLSCIPFAEYSREFSLIDSNTVSVAVGQDEKSIALIENIRKTHKANARALQLYSFSVYRWEFEKLLQQGVIDDYGSGVFCLTNPDYYNREQGVSTEGKDYFI